jgi:hypothetical protein
MWPPTPPRDAQNLASNTLRKIVVAALTASVMIVGGVPLAHTQATLHSQQKVNTPMSNSDIYSCASNNYDPNLTDNPLAALKWHLIGAYRGDYSGAEQISMMYGGYTKGIPKNPVLAYAWADIAAAMHGTCIDRLPATAGARQETNEREIKSRDAIGRDMTDVQIKEAQRFANKFKVTDYRWKWDSAHTPARYVRVSTIGPDCGDD